jgi:probable rRNA maturation factor
MKERDLYIHFSATERFEEIDYVIKSVVRAAVDATLEYEGFPYPAEVSVTFCSADYIRKLNKEYRNKDKATDVLSFPLYEDGDFDEEECSQLAALGDIVISVPRAIEQAAELGNSFEKEIAFLTVHSTLHLLGYDHERSADEDELQCEKQRTIINLMNL